jgi:hypothetical protein
LESASVPIEEVRQNFSRFKEQVNSKEKISEALEIDPTFDSKVIDPLVAAIKAMSFGKDDDFIEGLRKTQPRFISSLQSRVWTFSTLRMADVTSLRVFLGAQPNEVLFAMLLSAPEQDKQLINSLIPDGMKKSVVTDLYNKAKTKNDEREYNNAFKIARETLDKALKAHQNGKLPFAKQASA